MQLIKKIQFALFMLSGAVVAAVSTSCEHQLTSSKEISLPQWPPECSCGESAWPNWVKGHAGIEYNEICDQLCQKEIARNR